MAQLPVVFVTAGTDVHPYERLVRWTEELPGALDEEIRLVFQYGTSRPALGAENQDFYDSDGFAHCLDSADVVVAQGGPSSISEARRHGRLPIVVPRSGAAGEHVDDHQQRFAQMMADRGLVRVAYDFDELVALVHEFLTTDAGRIDPDTGPGDEFEQRLRQIVRDLRPLPWRAKVRRAWSSVRPLP